MTSTRTGPRGILVVCPCGNRFLVPNRQAGKRVTCTLCGAGLHVPASRSVDQAGSDAVGPYDREALWREIAKLEEGAPVAAKKPRIKRPAERTPWLSDPKVRKRIALAVGAGLCLISMAVAWGVAYRNWEGLNRHARNVRVSDSGGFAVRLPSGLTGHHSAQTLGPHPRWKYTFDGVRFADQSRVGVAYIDLRFDEPNAGTRELSDGGVAYLRRECLGEVSVVEECEIRLGRHPGRQVTYEHPGRGNRKSYGRWFQVGDRLYGVLWSSGFSEPSISDVARFLDSFCLLDERDAEVTLVQSNGGGGANGRR